MRLIPILSVLLSLTSDSLGQRRKLIRDMIQGLRNKPKSNSVSPSFNGEHEFDLIGTGELPLQGPEVPLRTAPDINDVITGSISRFENSNSAPRRDGEDDRHRPNAYREDDLPFITEDENPGVIRNRNVPGSRPDDNQEYPKTRFSERKKKKEPKKPFFSKPGKFSGPKEEFLDRYPSQPFRFSDGGPDRRPVNRFTDQLQLPGRFNDVPDRNRFAGGPPNRFNEHYPGRRPTNRFPDGANPFPDGTNRFTGGANRFPDGPPGRYSEELPDFYDRPQPSFPGGGPPDRVIGRPPSRRLNTGPQRLNRGPPGDLPATNGADFPPGPFRPRRQPYSSDRPNSFPKQKNKPNRKLVKGVPRKGPGGKFAPPEIIYNEFEPSFQDEGSEPFNEAEVQSGGGRRRNKEKLSLLEAEPDNFPHSLDNPFTGEIAFNGRRRYDGESVEDEPAHSAGVSAVSASDNEGFFSGVQESFPDLADFGMTWESKKIRTKRSALNNPFYYRDERSSRGRRRRVQQHRPRRPATATSNRRSQGPAGFWDDADFDSDFFNGGGPTAFNSYEDFRQGNDYTPQQRPVRQPEIHTSYRPKPQPIKKYYSTPDYFATNSRKSYQSYETGSRNQYEEERNSYNLDEKRFTYTGLGTDTDRYISSEDNEILGSGNFDVIKGGTFYDSDDYRYITNSNNLRPQYNEYGKDFFHNFRDFADIKNKNHVEQYY